MKLADGGVSTYKRCESQSDADSTLHSENMGKGQRVTYLRMLDDCFYSLAENPIQGRSRPDLHHALRSYSAGKHVVFYVFRKGHIVIVNVLHERIDPAKHI